MNAPGFASMFSGGGGWDLGALASGLDPRWSVELRPDIAGVLGENLDQLNRQTLSVVPRLRVSVKVSRAPLTRGHRTIVGDVTTVDYGALERVDVLAASPVCKRFSRAQMREARTPTDLDMASAEAVVRALQTLRPRVLFVENVSAYRLHPAFALIRDAARALSWYEAIEDLLPGFAPEALAPWQRVRLERMRERGVRMAWPLLVSSNNVKTPAWERGETVLVARSVDEPAWTVVSTYTAQSQTRVVFEDGRSVRVPPRGFARFMSFGDAYRLPDNNNLATTIVGNAVPPLLALRVLEPFVALLTR